MICFALAPPIPSQEAAESRPLSWHRSTPPADAPFSSVSARVESPFACLPSHPAAPGPYRLTASSTIARASWSNCLSVSHPCCASLRTCLNSSRGSCAFSHCFGSSPKANSTFSGSSGVRLDAPRPEAAGQLDGCLQKPAGLGILLLFRLRANRSVGRRRQRGMEVGSRGKYRRLARGIPSSCPTGCWQFVMPSPIQGC